jgi:predicted transcriptional regulator
MQHRSRTEIITSILEVVNDGSSFGDGGVSKTKITNKAFLNHAQLQEYLLILTEEDMIRYDGQTRTFKTTEKGLSFLRAYAQIDHVMKEGGI